MGIFKAKFKEKFKNKKKVALVLSGGGVKAAAFHLGACWALQKSGFRFAGGSPKNVRENFHQDEMTVKTYVGSSAGSIIAAFLASGLDIKTVIQSFLQRKSKKRGFFSFFEKEKHHSSSPVHFRPVTYGDVFNVNLKMSHLFRLLVNLFKYNFITQKGGVEVFLKKIFTINGLFNAENLDKYFRTYVFKENLNSFNSLGVDLYITATFLNWSKKVIFCSDSSKEQQQRSHYSSYATISEAIAASSSFSPFFAPYGIKNEQGITTYFFDGDTRGSLPAHVAEEAGCDLVIASYSIQPYHYNGQLGSLHHYGMPLIFNQALYQIMEHTIGQRKNERKKFKVLFQSLKSYLKSSSLNEEEVMKVLKIFKSHTQFREAVDTLYIHPDPKDHDMFFTDHFSLNEEILLKIVKKGFKSTVLSLKNF